MRTPNYMSPTSLKSWEANKDEYYLRYLATNRPPRMPQTQPMSVGSAFDAYVKSYLHNALYGEYGEYALDIIFEKQVEPHNRDWARIAGKHVYDNYARCGALADLMLELGTAVNKPRFEFDLLGTVETHLGDVPLLGKPDIFFINNQGARVILDWKVNGYCGNSTTSPMPGYIMCRDTWLPSDKKPSNGNRMPHKDCIPSDFKGLKINTQIYMEQKNEEWAAQLATYAWLLGEEVGSQELIVGIDQITGAPSGKEASFLHKAEGDLIAQTHTVRLPWLRVSSHRMRIGAAFQIDLQNRYAAAWSAITSGHIFSDLSREESDERCAMLDEQATLLSSEDELSVFVNSLRTT